MHDEAVKTRRFTRREYERLIEHEFFRPDDRIELVRGRLVVKEPEYPPHAATVSLVVDALRAAFGPGWYVRQSSAVALDRWSEPEPDVIVVPGTPRDYVEAHPRRPSLAVEVSLSRLGFDRHTKAAMYARAGIADYWIVNLQDRRLEVHREPARIARGRWGYRAIHTHTAGELVSPLAAPAARIAVADLLP